MSMQDYFARGPWPRGNPSLAARKPFMLGNHDLRMAGFDTCTAAKLFAVDWTEVEARTLAYHARDPYSHLATLLREQEVVRQGIA